MSKFLKGLLMVVVALLIFVGAAEARDSNFWVRIVDVTGAEITTGLVAYITTDGHVSPATVYSDGNRTALTNVVAGSDPGTDAVVKWWGSATEYGLYVSNGTYWDHFENLDVNDHRVVFVGKYMVPQSDTPKSPPGKMFIGTVALNKGLTYIAPVDTKDVNGESTGAWQAIHTTP